MNLREIFDYDAETGGLLWKPRFDVRPEWNTRNAGKPAGSVNPQGYVRIRLHGIGRQAHRLVWEWHNGPLPAGMEIDHINRVRRDNRIENLRLALPSQNRHNATPREGRALPRGVTFHRQSGLYQARTMFRTRKISLGYFQTPELAGEFYDLAVRMLHGDFYYGAKL